MLKAGGAVAPAKAPSGLGPERQKWYKNYTGKLQILTGGLGQDRGQDARPIVTRQIRPTEKDFTLTSPPPENPGKPKNLDTPGSVGESSSGNERLGSPAD